MQVLLCVGSTDVFFFLWVSDSFSLPLTGRDVNKSSVPSFSFSLQALNPPLPPPPLQAATPTGTAVAAAAGMGPRPAAGPTEQTTHPRPQPRPSV